MADLKDSGERRQWETGAVRDMAEGKGRCDLLPLRIAANLLGDDEIGEIRDPILEELAEFLSFNMDDTAYIYTALERLCHKAFGGSIANMLLEVAIHFEDGARKYGENNWQKGIPARCYLDSAIRHYLKWLRGDQDEPHDRACVWNLMCLIWEMEHHPDQSVYEEEPK